MNILLTLDVLQLLCFALNLKIAFGGFKAAAILILSESKKKKYIYQENYETNPIWKMILNVWSAFVHFFLQFILARKHNKLLVFVKEKKNACITYRMKNSWIDRLQEIFVWQWMYCNRIVSYENFVLNWFNQTVRFHGKNGYI